MTTMKKHAILRLHLLALAASLAAGCALQPVYQRPTTPEPVAFKEAEGWVPAAPSDALERGPWWQLFDDPMLNQLAASIEVSNQNVAVAVANYAQARALVAQQRAALFPSVSLGLAGERAGVRGQGADNAYRLSLGGSWEPDVWGRLRAGVASAQASLAASCSVVPTGTVLLVTTTRYFCMWRPMLRATASTYFRSALPSSPGGVPTAMKATSAS